MGHERTKRCKKQWKTKNPDKVSEQKRRYYSKTRDVVRSGHRWTAWEVEVVLTSQKTDRELSQELERSMQAIQVMRSKAKREIHPLPFEEEMEIERNENE